MAETTNAHPQVPSQVQSRATKTSADKTAIAPSPPNIPDLPPRLDHIFPSQGSLRKAQGKVGLVITRSVLWAYERGTWQYDVIVAAILAFIFLSPRSWFNDRPTLEMTNLRHQQGFVEIGRLNRTVQYQVDARLVESLGLKPEEAIPIIIRQHVQKPCTVTSIVAVRDRNDIVLGYTVVVEQLTP